MGFRLTVHIDKAPAIKDAKTEAIKGIKNTISVRNIPSRDQVELELVRLREKYTCLLYTSPSPRDRQKSRMPSSA